MTDEPHDTVGPPAGPSSTATVDRPAEKRDAHPRRRPPQTLPPYRVLLHNDDKNDMLYVVNVVRKLTGMESEAAWQRMMEAHETGVSLLLITHKERAELYRDQFASCGLTVTIEPDE